MKKIVLVFSILAVCLSFVACAKGPVIEVANVDITGKVDTALAEAKEVTVTVKNDSFKAIEADTDLSDWFTELHGLTAKVKTAVAAKGTSVVISVSGKPTSKSEADEAIALDKAEIKSYLTSEKEPTITANASAKFNIADNTTVRGAVAGKIEGTAGNDTLKTGSTSFVVTLTGATLKSTVDATAAAAYVQAACTPTGLTYTAAIDTAKNKITYTATATTVLEAVAKAALSIVVPKADIDVATGFDAPATDITITGDTTANYIFIDKADAAGSVSAKVETSYDISDAAYTPAGLTIALTGAKVKAAADGTANNIDVSGWFTGLPAGAKAVVAASVLKDATEITVKFTGTPSTAKAAATYTCTIKDVAAKTPAVALEFVAGDDNHKIPDTGIVVDLKASTIAVVD